MSVLKRLEISEGSLQLLNNMFPVQLSQLVAQVRYLVVCIRLLWIFLDMKYKAINNGMSTL